MFGRRQYLSIFVFLSTYVLMAAVIFLSFGYVNDYLLDIRSRVQQIAERAAATVDVQAHEQLRLPEQEDTDLYKRIAEPLRHIAKDNTDVQSIYTLRATTQPHMFTFVVDTQETKDANNNGVIDENEEKAHLGETYDATDVPDLELGFLAPTTDKNVNCDRWGCWISGYAPIRNAQGLTVAIVGVDVSADYYSNVQSNIKSKMVWIFLGGLCISLLFGAWGIVISRREKRGLLEDRDLLSHIVETSVEGIVVMDKSGMIRYANPTWLKMMQSTAEETLGKPLTQAMVPTCLDKNGCEALWSHARASAVYEYEMKMKRPDGTTYFCSMITMPLQASQGLSVLIGRDISDRKRAEEKMKEADEIRNKFIRIVSHQLRTPLNAIRWNLEALLGGELGPLKKPQKEFMRLTHDANVGVIARVHDMLTAMDIQEGHALIEKSPISLDALWTSVLPDFKKQCEAKSLVCTYQKSRKRLPVVDADPKRLRDVMEKLMMNAVVYTPERGRIKVSISATDNSVRFEITDSGVGIPESENDKIFTRFYRASNAHLMLPDGSGLGLYIAKHIIDAHGGRMGFDSTEGKGSTFWFELPVQAEE